MMCDIDRKNGKKYCEISLYTIVDAICTLVLQTMLCKTAYKYIVKIIIFVVRKGVRIFALPIK